MKKVRVLFYKWHNWVGIILSVPILIVSITAVVIAFNDELSTDKVNISNSFLPGYYFDGAEGSFSRDLKEVKSVYTNYDTVYIGTKAGLVVKAGGNIKMEKEITGFEVRKVVKINSQLYVAGKNGLWIKNGNGWNKILDQDVHDISGGERGILYAALAKNGLIYSSNNFINYNKAYGSDEINAITKTISVEGLPPYKKESTLKELILDLHTGKAFFGKRGEWIWISMVGLCVTVLVITGGYLWLRKKIRKTKAA